MPRVHMLLLIAASWLSPSIRSLLLRPSSLLKQSAIRRSWSFQRYYIRLNMAVLEVEQKFCFDADSAAMASRLENLGFEKKGQASFTDWYFDDLTVLALSLQDCWLRYRETNGKGQWQLKRRKLVTDGFASTSLTTVYQEVEGQQAVEGALFALESFDAPDISSKSPESASSDPMLDISEHEIPVLPVNQRHSLLPFARFTTTRSTLVPKSELPNNGLLNDILGHDIQVDLDTTDSNYAVGEVEIVVEKEHQIPHAKERIQRVISVIVDAADDGDESVPPQGKLEHFLFHNRPNHYKALMEAGIMK